MALVLSKQRCVCEDRRTGLIPPDDAENLDCLATRIDARRAGKVTGPNGDRRIWAFSDTLHSDEYKALPLIHSPKDMWFFKCF